MFHTAKRLSFSDIRNNKYSLNDNYELEREGERKEDYLKTDSVRVNERAAQVEMTLYMSKKRGRCGKVG